MDERIQSLAWDLVRRGLAHAFGVTGSGPSQDLILALERFGVMYYPVSHEAAGAIMAGAVATSTGRPALSLSIKGPGLGNMLPGLLYNRLEGNSAVSASEAFEVGAPLSRQHKRMNQAGLLAHAVKKIVSLGADGPDVEELLRVARSEVPGPVHVELADSIQAPLESFDNVNQVRPNTSSTLEQFRRLLNSSTRPVLIVGSLARRRRWAAQLASLRIPVFTTVAAKGVIPESGSFSAGIYTGDGKERSPEASLIPKADLIIGIGLRNTEVLTPRPFDVPVALADEVNAGLGEGFGADMQLSAVGDDVVRELIRLLRTREWGAEHIGQTRSGLAEMSSASGWLPAYCFQTMNRLAYDHMLVLDTGAFCTIGEHLWLSSPTRPFLGSSNHRWMGVAIPSAIGGSSKQGAACFLRGWRWGNARIPE